METLLRNREIYNKRISGKTLDELAEIYGLSRERVRQICRKQEYLAKNNWFPINDKYDIKIYKTLKRNGIDTEDRFLRCEVKDFEKMRGFGTKSVDRCVQLQTKLCKKKIKDN